MLGGRLCYSIQNVAKNFGKNAVLRNISLEIGQGEFLTILGEQLGKDNATARVAGFEREFRRSVDGRRAIGSFTAAVSAASEYGFSSNTPYSRT